MTRQTALRLTCALAAVGMTPAVARAQVREITLNDSVDVVFSGVTLAPDGLYGTAGGPYGSYGFVYKIDLTGHYTVLHNFGFTDGWRPYAGVILDAAGNLYGTTQWGGSCIATVGCGVVYKLDATGHLTVLYNFTGLDDGGYPTAGVILDAAGNLYGTTQNGGTANNGVVYKLDAAGHYSVLYRFTGGSDGGQPIAGVIRDSAGSLYGTTVAGGGTSGCGVVYKLDATGHLTVLHSFTGDTDGCGPQGGVIGDAGGPLYGTTTFGGLNAAGCFFGGGGLVGCGVVYKLDTTGYTVLHSFAGGADSGNPGAGVTRDPAGNLYGTAGYRSGDPQCSEGNCGVVYKLDKTGNYSVLYSFTGGTNGESPTAGVVRGPAGNLFGTTYYTVFALTGVQ